MPDTDPLLQAATLARRGQVAAASTAFARPPQALDPLLLSLPHQVVACLRFETDSTLAGLWCGTRTGPEHGLDGLLERLDHPTMAAWILQGLLEDGPTSHVDVDVEDTSAIRLTVVGPRDLMTVYQRLGQELVEEQVRRSFSDLTGRLQLDQVAAVGVELRRGEEPAFRVVFDAPIPAADRPRFASQMELSAASLGVPEAHARWFGNVVEGLAPRSFNRLQVTVQLTRQALVPEVEIRYPDVPERLVLKLFHQLSGQDVGARLGALAGLAPPPDGRIPWAHVVAPADGHLRAGLTLVSEGLPGSPPEPT